MTHLMADGIRVCGRPDGHTGKHYSQATIQREADRMRTRRETPGPCTMKGCTLPCHQYATWHDSYDVRCYIHADLHQSSKRLRRFEEEWERMGGKPLGWTQDELDGACRRVNESAAARQTAQVFAMAFTVKSSTPIS